MKPWIRNMMEEYCTEILADLVRQVAYLECRMDDFWDGLQDHLRSHRAEIDAADWWKHGNEPT
jgi:hypothetical protein